MRKLLSIMLALTMILAMGVISASAADPKWDEGRSSTNVTYTVGTHYDAEGDEQGSANYDPESTGGYDYFFIVPQSITIGGTAGVAEIRGVNATAVTLTAPANVGVGRDATTEVTADITLAKTAGANDGSVSGLVLTMPANITAVQSAKADVTVAFGAGNAPLAQGTYTGSFAWTAGLAS